MVSPEAFFGFKPGSDRHMIRYEKILEYLYELEKDSDRIVIREYGKTMEGGRPFAAAFISSAENLNRLDELSEISRKLSSPDRVNRDELPALVENGKCFVMVSMSMHSNEVGGTQTAPQLAYELIANDDKAFREMREECVVILIPCGNPDGEIDFCDWYDKYLGTKFEGCCSPHLRHIYAGHSNNRDGVHVNLDETYYLNRILMTCKPQAFLDHHHQSPWMERLTITPGTNPMSNECSPLQMRELKWLSEGMAQDLTRQKVRGVVTADEFYDCWCYPIQQEIVRLQNISGILAESADALIATPIYIPPEKLEAHTIPCVECPDPWEGGWWRLGDIVRQQLLSTYALLKLMAKNREQILSDMTLKAFEQIERGKEDKGGAFLIPRGQHDVSSLKRLLRILDLQDIRYYELAEPYRVKNTVYPEGTYAVPLDQPYYGLVRMLLDKCFYPINRYTQKADGTIRISDMATLNITDLMGVETARVGKDASLKFREHTAPEEPAGLKGSENAVYAKVNRMLSAGETVWRDSKGDFNLSGEGRKVSLRKIGLLKMSSTGNSEEGYTRLLFKRFDFPYRIVMDTEIRSGAFDDIDLLIIPGDSEAALRASGEARDNEPAECAHGLGEAGFKNLRTFVQNGGRIVAWEAACCYACEAAGMPIVNQAANLGEDRLNAHGSALRVVYTPCELTYGMEEESIALYRNGPVFASPGFNNLSAAYHTFARFASRDLLADGMLFGEGYIAGQPCGMVIDCGKGDVVITGFDPKFRNQTDVSYKVLFNALYRYE